MSSRLSDSISDSVTSQLVSTVDRAEVLSASSPAPASFSFTVLSAAVMMTLILIGGLCYTVGAVIYGLKRPNPFPGRFGFHEIFHTLTLLAFLCHWTGIFIVATNPPILS